MKAETVSPGRPRASSSWLGKAAVILLGALFLLWPTLVNRSPFFLSDTTTYVRGADAAAFQVFGVSTDWTDRFIDRYQPSANPAGASPSTQPQDQGRPVTLSGRSIYYGAFLYAADRIAGLRLAAAIQAILASLCLYLTVSRFISNHRDPLRPFLALTILLAVASSLAFFTGYLTPDIFVGLGILSAAHLLVRSPSLGSGERLFWFSMLCWSALTHSSNILILLIVVTMLLVARLLLRIPDLRSIGVVACAIGVGIVGELLFAGAVKAVTGDAPVRPPFLMARIIADGPGSAYLKESCPGSGFALCNHLDRLSHSSDGMLWGETKSEGIFSTVSNDERRRIADEEPRFVLAVIADRPLDIIRSTAASVLDQAAKWRLSEFNSFDGDLIGKLPRPAADEFKGSRAYLHAMPVRAVEFASLAATLVGLGLVIWTFFRREGDRGVRLFLAVLLLGIGADIFVCGAISTPHDRYSMRVLWLIPMGAFITLAGRNRFGVRDRADDPMPYAEKEALGA